MEAKQTKTLILLGVMMAAVLALAGVATALEVGERAPDFTLQSTNKEKIRLSQFRGKRNVLIQFYTTDFNPT